MKEINVSQLADNMIEAIGKEWMLVTAGTKEKFNMGKDSCIHIHPSGTLHLRVYPRMRHSDTVIPRRGKQSYT